MTSTNPHGHNRRRSRATSHRSQPSINSDSGHNGAYDDDDPNDDSGIGGEVQGSHQLLQIPQNDYAVRESYHDAITDYGPDAYYR